MQKNIDEMTANIQNQNSSEEDLRKQLEVCIAYRKALENTLAAETGELHAKIDAMRNETHTALEANGISAEILDSALQKALAGQKNAFLALLRRIQGVSPDMISSAVWNAPPVSSAPMLLKEHELRRLVRLPSIAAMVQDDIAQKNPLLDSHLNVLDFRRHIARDILPEPAEEASLLLSSLPKRETDQAVPRLAANLSDCIRNNIQKVIGDDAWYKNHELIIPKVRWMIRRDMPEVLGIEDTSFDRPWDIDRFIHHLRQRNCIGMVAEYEEQVIGYMVYELHKRSLNLLNIAVHGEYRRLSVGESLIRKLRSKLSPPQRSSINTLVTERNTQGIRSLLTLGFAMEGIEQKPCENDSGDEIRLSFKYSNDEERMTYREPQEWLQEADAFLTRVA